MAISVDDSAQRLECLSTPSGVSVSIIICTYNRAAGLRKTLDALAKVRIRSEWKAELILVDNASTDNTAMVARSATLPKIEVRYLYEPKQGLSYARNAALAQARGDVILFTDDDVLPAEDWVEHLVSALVTDTCDAVTGQFTPARHLLRPWLTPIHKWWLADSDAAKPRDGVRELLGGNMGFRRSVLERVRAFDPELGRGALGFADDTLFGWQLARAGYRIQYVPAARVIHQFDVSRLQRTHWLSAARERGRTGAYLRYHWEHADIPFPRLMWLWYFMKLRVRRVLQRPQPLESEGCPLWEMSYVRNMEMCSQFCLERQRPRNYSRHGLTKRSLSCARNTTTDRVQLPLTMHNTQAQYDHLFETEHLREQLMDKAVRGGLSIMTAQGASLLLRTGSMLILARLLMPEHFGLIGMVTAITTIAERFKDLGLSTVTVQQNKITHEQVSALFWINLGFGTLLMAIISTLAWVIAGFFGDDRLVGITLAISSSFFLGGLTVQHEALLRRQMRFGKLAWIQVVAEGLSLALGIGLAWQGFEYWSLVWKEVARSTFVAAGTWLTCRWWPGLPARATGLGRMLRFGRDISGFNLVTFLSQNLDGILLGKFWGAGPLGIYRQARQMISMLQGQLHFPVDVVAYPTLSALQNDPAKYSTYLRNIVSVLAFAVMPLVTYLAIFSDTLVRVLLGEKWMASALIFRILALAALLWPPASTRHLVLITCGKTMRNFWYSVMSALLLTLAFSIGTFWGPIGVATAYTITAYVWILPSLWYCLRDTPVSIRGILRAVCVPALCSFVMGLLLLLASPELSKLGSLEIPLSLGLAVLSYFGVWLLFPGGMRTLTEYFTYPLLSLRGRVGSDRVGARVHSDTSL